ncbi:hypothetical protein GCM10010411_74550 [Actinomadura fulvescens]|uniref:Uncharacterized protein n=1 Tax=Actinomadura fulvescens TaxID=46160 RepID=A0ABP6CRF6_9ACTN
MTVRADHKTLLAMLAAERHWTHPDGVALGAGRAGTLHEPGLSVRGAQVL